MKIAKDAKTCPNCGAKNKSNIGCGVFIVAILIIFAIGVASSRTKSASKNNAGIQAIENKGNAMAPNPTINQALAYLRKVDGVCRVDIVNYDVFISFANNQLPDDYKMVANAAAMNGSRALLEAGETPSRCTVWVIPAGEPAKVDNAYYTTTARKGKAQ